MYICSIMPSSHVHFSRSRPHVKDIVCYKTGCSKQGTELSSHLIEQRLGVLQVWGVEALSEPAVNFAEHRVGLVATALFCKQARETHRRTQLKRFCALPARDFD